MALSQYIISQNNSLHDMTKSNKWNINTIILIYNPYGSQVYN